MPAWKFEKRAYGIESVADIKSQLDTSEERYQGLLKKLEMGEEMSDADSDYIEEMRKNLADFKNILLRIGVRAPGDVEISNRITSRLESLPKSVAYTS